MLNILFVDDSMLSRRKMADILATTAHTYTEASSGAEVLELLASQSFDCLITDLLMPNMTGQELLSEIRKRGNNIPTIVVTADIQDATRDECEALVINGFLNKPVKERDLLACLDEMLTAQESLL